MSVTATLYYGFELGSPGEDTWKVREVDEYGSLKTEGLPWAQAAKEDDDYPEHLRAALLSEAGVEAAEMSSSEMEKAVAQHWGVVFVEHGYVPGGLTHLGIALKGAVYESDDWTAKSIAPSTHGQSHMLLLNALLALGLTPVQANPSWLLAPGER